MIFDMRLLVTGATGFIGSAVLVRFASDRTLQLRGAVRCSMPDIPANGEWALVSDLTPDMDWTQAVNGIDVIVHTAARVHVMRDSIADPLAEFRRVNVAGTLNLARQAVLADVRRFVFISSIKVNGEQTLPGRPYAADDVPIPVDPYGISKHEAELGLMQLAQETGMEVVIIRPVLVYGPAVKANFLRLLDWVWRGVPLPLGSVRNLRSLVYLGNLVDAIVTCVTHPKAAGQTFLVSDREDVSTPELIRRMARALGRPARLLPVPPGLLRAAGKMLGKGDEVGRLLDSLVIDSSKIRRELGWRPPFTMEEGLRETAAWYRRTHG